MSVRAMRQALALFLGGAVVLAGTLAGIGAFVYHYPERRHGGDGRAVEVLVRKGEALPQLAADLAADGVIAHPFLFRLFVSRAGKAGRLRPGRYTLTDAMTPREVLERLSTGIPDRGVPVTIPEGKNILFVAEALARAGVAPEADVLAAERDPAVVRELGVPGPTLEGYLFPDTYELRPGTPAVKTLAVMVRRQQEVWAELARGHAAEVDALRSSYGFDERAIVTLASIVEKETASPEERPRVAAVFLNRLRLPAFQPKLLETDPTILYGCSALAQLSRACSEWRANAERGDERIHAAQLRDPENPYNTYTHAGLPPGPICNPGRAALLAVLDPHPDDYLYFVAKDDGSGTHYFSRTRAEHEQAVDRYQRHGAHRKGAAP